MRRFFGAGRACRSLFSISLFQLAAALIVLCPSPARAQATPQDQSKEPLGSLTSMGDVYVNNSKAPYESTIFAGDTVRVGESGAATFTMSGEGSLKLSPMSQVVFSGESQYTAELGAGSVVISSAGGSKGLTLRVGDDVVVASIQEESASAKIDKGSDGSFHVSCLNGSVGVLSLTGNSGQFIQSGQALNISPNGGIVAAEQQASHPGPVVTNAKTIGAANSHKDWVYLGVAGAAGGAAAGIALAHHGGQSVSPSSP